MKKLVLFIVLFFLISTLKSEEASNYLTKKSTHFILNEGQWKKNVKALAVGSSYQVWITENSLVFDVQLKNEKNDLTRDVFSYKFENGNLSEINPHSQKQTKLNYFIGKNNPIIDVKVYDSLSIKDIYNKIDLKLKFEKGNLRYDFVVHPGGEPSDINYSVSENCKLELKDDALELTTDNLKVKNVDLYSFQTNSSLNNVKCLYSIKDGVVSFEIGNYNKEDVLIIDPIVKIDSKTINAFGTKSYAVITDVETSNETNPKTIFVGYTASQNFPVTFGTSSGYSEGIFGEMEEDINGNLIIPWMTFYGGSREDKIYSVDLEKNKIYFTGTRYSPDLPIDPNTAYYDQYVSSIQDRSNFVAVFSITGTQHKYSSYLRNCYTLAYERFPRIEVANNGTIYLTGTANIKSTVIPNFYEYKPITTQDRTNHGFPEACSFIMALDEVQNSNPLSYNLKFCSTFSGNQRTYIADFDIDENENIYLTGSTESESNSFYTTPNSFREVKPNFDSYSYFTKLHFDGNNLVIDYNSFFAKSIGSLSIPLKYFEDEAVKAIVYADNKLFIGGATRDTIPTLNAFDDVYNQNLNGFEAYISAFELNSNGYNDLVYSSYFGGDSISIIEDLDYNYNCEQIVFSGVTFSELDGYYGIIDPQSQYYRHDGMIGAIDLRYSDQNTLRHLAYYPSYSYANILAVDTDSKNHFSNYFNIGGEYYNIPYHDALLGIYNKTSCYSTQDCTCDPLIDDKSLVESRIISQSTTCNDDECEVKFELSVGRAIPSCYTHVEFSAELNGVEVHAPVKIPINGSVDLNSLTRCIKKGHKYELILKFYEGEFDPEPCVYKELAYCPVAEPRTYCTPDCEDDEFDSYNLITEIPGCPGCQLSVSYSARTACNGNYDIRIDGMEWINNNPNNTYACTFCSVSELYELAVQQIILRNKMGFAPVTHNDPCSNIYRVIMSSCWAEADKYNFGGPLIDIHLNTTRSFIPCESVCCGISLTVCRPEEGKVHITNNGPIFFDQVDCSNTTELVEFYQYDIATGQQYGYMMYVPCEERCEELVNIEGGLVIPFPYASLNNPNTNILLNEVNLGISAITFVENKELIINFNSSSNAISTVEIYNIEGKLIYTKVININAPNAQNKLSLTEYNSGTYLVRINYKGTTIHSNKFIIEK